jgi:ParB family chromosome partitioning protein
MAATEKNSPFKRKPVGHSSMMKELAHLPEKGEAPHFEDFASTQNEGNLLEVPLSHIIDNPFNARAVHSQSGIDVLALSMQGEAGQTTAATGYRGPDGRIHLIDGHRRLRAAREARLDTLRVELRPAPATDALLYLASRAANFERENQTCLDDAITWKLLLSKGVFDSQGALAKALNISDAEVSRTINLSVIPTKIVQVLADQPKLLNLALMSALREYYEATSEEEALALVFDIIKNDLSAKQVRMKVADAKSATPRLRPRSEKIPLKYGAGRGELSQFRGTGRVELKLKGLTEEELEQVSEKLGSLFVAKL